CQACRERFRHPLQLVAESGITLRSEDSLLSRDLVYEQIRAYVDGELIEQDRLALEDHLSTCSVCKREVADLQSLKASIDEDYSSSPEDVPGSSREPARLPVPVLSNRQRWPHRRLVTVAASLALFAIAAWPITRAFQKIRTPVGPPRQSEAET